MSISRNSEPQAVIAAVQLPGVTDEAFESSLIELERLAHTLGLAPIARVTQRRAALAHSAVLGEGKLKELGALTGGRGVVPSYSKKSQPEPEPSTSADSNEPKARASVVLVDHELTPGQLRNLERATGAEVLDRSMVILAIFARHARTREARMQVEIAQLTYMAPRLRETHAGRDRQRGGIGGR